MRGRLTPHRATPAAADFNGDGFGDIVCAGVHGQWVTLPVAFGAGSLDGAQGEDFVVTNHPIDWRWNQWASQRHASMHAIDVNGDGRDDLVLSGVEGWHSLPVAYSRGDGTFHVTNDKSPYFSQWTQYERTRIVPGDFDGDGKGDLAVSGGEGWTVVGVALSTSRYAFSNDHEQQQQQNQGAGGLTLTGGEGLELHDGHGVRVQTRRAADGNIYAGTVTHVRASPQRVVIAYDDDSPDWIITNAAHLPEVLPYISWRGWTNTFPAAFFLKHVRSGRYLVPRAANGRQDLYTDVPLVLRAATPSADMGNEFRAIYVPYYSYAPAPRSRKPPPAGAFARASPHLGPDDRARMGQVLVPTHQRMCSLRPCTLGAVGRAGRGLGRSTGCQACSASYCRTSKRGCA